MDRSGMDFLAYIADRTRDFTGREWVFAEIDRWPADPNAPRFFIITGEPGIGKTAIAARLTQIRDLAAVHFCIAHQADTIDPLNFARSLSHQVTCIDGFARGILEDQGVHVDVHINAQEKYGQIIGVQIENLLVEAPSAAIAFNRAVLDPLRRLYADSFDRQLVILVNALDEAVQQRGPESPDKGIETIAPGVCGTMLKLSQNGRNPRQGVLDRLWSVTHRLGFGYENA